MSRTKTRNDASIPWALLAALSLLGCGADGGEATPTDTTAELEASSADTVTPPREEVTSDAELEEEVVEFHVQIYESESGSGSATAGRHRVFEGPIGESLTVGPCTFVRPAPWDFCDPACVPPEYCGAEGLCVLLPGPLGAGDIAVTGLTVGLTLAPETRYMYYQAVFDAEPPDGDLFSEGAIIEATATGGDVPPFTVSVQGVADLVTPLACPPVLDPEEDLVVSWEPAAEGGTIHFTLASANHGAQYSRIHCEGEDTGEFVVDRSLIAAWLTDWHPVESWRLERSRRGATEVPPFRAVLSASYSVGCSW